MDEIGAAIVRSAITTSPHKGPRLRQDSQLVADPPRELFLEVCPAWTGSVVIDRTLLDAARPFDETRRYAEDVDLWIRLSARSRFAFDPTVTAHHRRNSRSLIGTAEAGAVDQVLADVYVGR